LRQIGIQGGEIPGDLRADCLDRHDAADSDDADEQAVLDQVLPLIFTNETNHQTLHVTPPKSQRTVNERPGAVVSASVGALLALGNRDHWEVALDSGIPAMHGTTCLFVASAVRRRDKSRTARSVRS